jgi:hypothetical protein
MRNDILIEIIVALGGSVTNPNDRNALLIDWKNALGV